jgi:hypothetical protein
LLKVDFSLKMPSKNSGEAVRRTPGGQTGTPL